MIPAFTLTCWIAGAVAIIGGLVALYWALLHDRPRGRKRCPKCWYDMAGAPTLTCPECGHTASSPLRLSRTRRRWRWAPAAALLTIAGTAAAAWPRADARGWLSFVPAPVLYTLATSDWIFTNAPRDHLIYRSAAAGEITGVGRAILVRQCIRTLRRSSNVDHRDQAGSILAFIGARDSRITPALIAALDDPVAQIRVRAIRSLGIYHADADRAVPALMRVLERGAAERPEVRTETLGVLSKYRERAAAAAPLFLEALQDPDPAVSTHAAATMHCVGVDPALHLPRFRELFFAAKDSPNLIWNAATAIGQCGHAAADDAPALAALLIDSPDAGVQDVVLIALARIGPEAEPALPTIAAFAQQNPAWTFDADVAMSVIRAEHPSIVAALAAQLKDVDPAVRAAAASRLRRLTWIERDRSEVLRHLVHALDDDDENVVVRAISGIANLGRDAEACLPRLRQLRRDGVLFADYGIEAIERAETPALAPEPRRE